MGVGLAVAVAIALGPRPTFTDVWVEPELPHDLDGWLAEREAAVPEIREGDGKAIVWLDPERHEPTPLSLVYLHGFSADRHELEPVISDVARTMGMNVFFTRLAGHGRGGAAMGEVSVDDWLEDAGEAIAIGGRIGERVVVVGTSTGGTLATWIATKEETHPRLAGLVLVSPNFHPQDRSSRMLLYPWGQRLARLVVGRERCFTPENERQARHWTTCYPVAALPPMMALVEHVRTMDLSGVDVPTLLLYSPLDGVVDPHETARALAALDPALLTKHVVTTEDPSHHVLAGDILSPGSNEAVATMIADFLRTLLR